MWFLAANIILTCSFTVATGISCWSDDCRNGEEFCIEQCPENYTQCSAVVRIDHLGTIHPYGLHCISRENVEECRSEECVMEVNVETHSCCCTGELCNSVYGLTPTTTSEPSGTPPSVPDTDQVCEFYNCSGDSSAACFHGYVSCSDHPLAETVPDPSHHYCVATYARDESSGLYELFHKGCHFSEPSTADNCTADRCHVEYAGDDSHELRCCCDGPTCNKNVTFSDPSRFAAVNDPCSQANCDSCLRTSTGETVCFCRKGYALASDNTCEDIDECKLGLDDCTSPQEKCVNTDGGYNCECTLGYKPEGDNCIETHLTCQYKNCSDCTEDHEYCDGHGHTYCQATYIKVGDTFLPHLKSCIFYDTARDCNENVCILSPNSRGVNIYFCCCTGNLCNSKIIIPGVHNHTQQPILSSTSTHSLPSTSLTPILFPNSTKLPDASTIPQPHSGNSFDSLHTTLAIVCSVLVLIVFVIVSICVATVVRKKWHSRSYLHPTLSPQMQNMSQMFGLQVRLLERIGHGQFASVWKATIGTEEETEIAAVKVFSKYVHKQSFERELGIYLTPQLEHENILKYITNETQNHDLYLVLAYHPNGSLYDLLKHRSLNLDQFFKLAHGAAAGLAHLHSEVVEKGNCLKAAIVHRDLKSKNILVTSDFDACISDFGLAVALDGASSCEVQTQVGTARYMSPEVLEGAVYFRLDCFQKIDVYALSLILWEISLRTEIPGVSLEEYRPPFSEWGTSANPSVEEMTSIVVHNRRRPKMPKGFVMNSDLDEIVQTIAEGWDHDAEGRLTASCIEERIRTLGQFKMKESTSKFSFPMVPNSPSSSNDSSISKPPWNTHQQLSRHGSCFQNFHTQGLSSIPLPHHYSMNHFTPSSQYSRNVSETTV